MSPPDSVAPPTTESLWAFSLEMFARDGVGPACIELQDRCAVQVNLLLLFCWLGASGRGALDDDEIARARAVSEPWQREIVAPLRELRRRIKDWPDDAAERPAPTPEAHEAYRKQVIGLEIEGERLEQEVLAAAFERPATPESGPASRAEHAARSLARYFAQLRIPVGADEARRLAVLLGAVFPELDAAAIDRLAGLNRS